jgi:hypothetical protein
MKRPFGLNCNPSNGVPFEAAAFAPQEAPVKIGHTSTLVHNIHIGSTKWVNNKLVNKYTLVNTLVNKYTLVVHIGGTHWWYTLVVHIGGTHWWYTLVVVHIGGTHWWYWSRKDHWPMCGPTKSGQTTRQRPTYRRGRRGPGAALAGSPLTSPRWRRRNGPTARRRWSPPVRCWWKAREHSKWFQSVSVYLKTGLKRIKED